MGREWGVKAGPQEVSTTFKDLKGWDVWSEGGWGWRQHVLWIWERTASERLRQALVGGVSLYPTSGSGSGLGSSLALSELFAFFPFQHLCPPFSFGAQQFTEA